jgi:NADPH2 dehydrogenase
MRAFEAYQVKGLRLKNRIVMPPMCMYSADSSGKANDFHDIHYTSRAMGGVGLIIVEAAGIIANGRISENDLGLWNNEQRDALVPIVKKVHMIGSKIAIQLAHSGRKHIGESEMPVAPSAIAFDENSRVPIELSVEQIAEVVNNFRLAAIRADEAGFDAVEIHCAHGYLLHQFLSPLSNQREDDYGGSLMNRVRILKEVLSSVREVFSEDKPILLRISATDYIEGGLDCEDLIQVVNQIKEYVDIVHVSSAGLLTVPMDVYPGYQLSYSQKIKQACNIDTIAVGLITNIEMVEEIISNNRADLVALGRELLRNPYFVYSAARNKNLDIDYPEQYRRAF